MYIHVVHTKGHEMPAIGKNEDRLRHMLTPLCMQLFNLIGPPGGWSQILG